MSKKENRLFLRSGSRIWQIRYYDADGIRRRATSATADRAQAEKVLARILREVEKTAREAERARLAGTSAGPVTFKAFCAEWIARRKRLGIKAADQDEQRLKDHIPDWLQNMAMEDFRTAQTETLIDWLKTERSFSPRMIHHVAHLVRQVFGDAAYREVIPTNPIEWRKGLLPKKRDKDPARKFRAKFSREEVELLISHSSVPEDRRALYAWLALCGARPGEAFAARWSDRDPGVKPLGRIVISRAWDSERRIESLTKTEDAREVPEHPTLRKTLAAWKLGGWERHFGRPPTPGDLIFPVNVADEHRTTVQTWKFLKKDCLALGITVRWTHAFRHTFTSLAKDDGANPAVVELFTHPPQDRESKDVYTHWSWERLCAELSKLNVQLLEGRVLPLVASQE